MTLVDWMLANPGYAFLSIIAICYAAVWIVDVIGTTVLCAYKLKYGNKKENEEDERLVHEESMDDIPAGRRLDQRNQ